MASSPELERLLYPRSTARRDSVLERALAFTGASVDVQPAENGPRLPAPTATTACSKRPQVRSRLIAYTAAP